MCATPMGAAGQLDRATPTPSSDSLDRLEQMAADAPASLAGVDAFLAAARDGDFDALVTVLHPDVVLRSDGGTSRRRHTTVITGARAVATQAATFGRLSPFARPVLVNGAAGVLVTAAGRPLSVMAFTVTHGKIAAIDVIADLDRLRQLDLAEDDH